MKLKEYSGNVVTEIKKGLLTIRRENAWSTARETVQEIDYVLETSKSSMYGKLIL